MSVRMFVRGEYRIDPPLTLAEVEKSSFLSEQEGGSQITDIVLSLEHEERRTETEVITTITCSRVIPWSASAYDPCNLLENVQGLVAECRGHAVTGEVVAYDADLTGYVMRVVADADGVREEKARMIWPDGSEVEPLH